MSAESAPTDSLAIRIDRLEHRLRRGRRAWISLVGVVVAITLMGVVAQPSDEADGILRARGLIIEDADGRARVVLGAPAPGVDGRDRANGANAMIFLGEDGAERVAIGDLLSPQIEGQVAQRIAEGWGITIHDEKGNERGGYAYLTNGRVVFGMDFPGGNGEAITLAVIDGQYAAIMIGDETGARERAGIYVGKDGPALLKLGGADGTRVQLLAETGEEAKLLKVDPSDWSMVDVMPKEKP